MTADELRKAEARYQRAFRRLEALRVERNEAVWRAVEDGWTHARIAEATGMSRTRVGQIALTSPGRSSAGRTPATNAAGAESNVDDIP